MTADANDADLAPSPDPVFEDIADAIARHARARPADPCITYQDQTLSWGEFDRRLNQVAHALIALGVGPSDKVALVGRNSLRYAEALFGTLRAGGCAVPLPTMVTAQSLQMMLDDSDSKVLFLEDEFFDLAGPATERPGKLVPGGLIGLDFCRPGWAAFDDLVGAQPDTPPGRKIEPEWHFNIIYSSGTTGVPKGILHDRALRWRTVCGPLLAALGFGPGGITLVSTPLYSNTTMAAVLPSLYWGSQLVLMRRFDVVGFLQLAQRYRVTHAMLVPVQYDRLLDHADVDAYDLSSFVMKFSTSAPLRASVKRALLNRWPGGLMEIYGLTEGGAACVLMAHLCPDKLHTVGVPGANADLRIIDEKGNELPRGEVGEVVGRGPLMMTGYYKRPEETAAFTYVSKDGLVFFRQGDMGRLDEDGFLELLDRKKDMIISGGFNVYASDLEVELLKHPAVADVAVIGIPSAEWGESPYAFIVRRPGATEAVDAIVAWANARLGKLQRLAGGELRDDLPRSSIGKILKRDLRAPFWRGTERNR
jgi:acyl-CoA synthetase (AMP-forming)/AMP-acid ligase II